MAELCTYEFANYPDSGFIERKTYQNPTNADNELIQRYNTYLKQGELNSANQLLNENPDLKNKMITSDDPNRWEEEIRNAQITASQEKQAIYYKDMPAAFKDGDIFIGVMD